MSLFNWCLISVLGIQCLLFLFSILIKNAGISEIGSGLGYIAIIGFSSYSYTFRYVISCFFAEHTQEDPAFILIVILLAVFGLRLVVIGFRCIWRKPEDARYTRLRQDWGRLFELRSFLQFFILPAIPGLMMGYPVMRSATDSHTVPVQYTLVQDFLIALGLLFCLSGFLLLLFRRGRFFRELTPRNSFPGEAAFWLGVFVISCVSARDGYGVWLRMAGLLGIAMKYLYNAMFSLKYNES